MIHLAQTMRAAARAGRPPKAAGTDAEQVTQFVMASRRLLRRAYAARQVDGSAADRRKLFPVTLPSMAQFRTTRRIVGRETMTDGQHGLHRPDSIGLVADWRKAGYVWEIPYGALLPQRVTGLSLRRLHRRRGMRGRSRCDPARGADRPGVGPRGRAGAGARDDPGPGRSHHVAGGVARLDIPFQISAS